MIMDKLLKLQIHQLVQDFLHRINQNDRQGLFEYNQVTDAMLEELHEELNSSFEDNYQLSIIPFEELPEAMPKNMPLFHIEVMDKNCFLVECNIYNFGKITDLKLQIDIDKESFELILTRPLFRS